ncbi:hypothetical protein QCA50_014951 [Cerrena zonata]|uniref:Transcription and mRNA export factor SUS1 n=1 Tax=Cerrena zonata TaxID=2478898 RepID=A0AAW0FXE2_9APHY
MPSREINGSSVSAEMHAEVQRRLVESGEWDRISRLLHSKLNESGWADRLHDQAKELARSKYPIAVQDITEDVRSTAIAEVPEEIRLDVLAKLRHYLDSQLEK